MAKRPTITTLASSIDGVNTINANDVALRNAFDNTVSRDGSTPNYMEADFDLNNNDLLNVAEVTCASMTLAGVPVTATTIVTSLPASGVTVADGGGYYTGTEVEAVLQEIGADVTTAQSDITTLQTDVLREVIQIACSDETTSLTTGTKVTFRMPFAMTLTEVRASVTTAPTGSTIVVDVHESGTTVLSTKVTIDISEKTSTTAATPAVISDSALADDAEIKIDIDQIGSTIAGAGLKVTLIGTRA